MSPQAAFQAGFKHTENDRRLSDARAFWLSSFAIRNLVREGRHDEAVPILREMRKSAKALSADHLLGRRMQSGSQDLFFLMVKLADDRAAEAVR